MINKYYAEYHSSSSGTTGCVKAFLSESRDRVHFPPQVNYRCDLCNTTHGFRLHRTYTVATPGQDKRLEEYCKTYQLERDVNVPE